MCGVAAMRQQASIEEEDVYYISMDNKVCVDMENSLCGQCL